MHKKEQMRLLKGLMHHLDNKTNIDAGGIIRTPADTYTSEERFDIIAVLSNSKYSVILCNFCLACVARARYRRRYSDGGGGGGGVNILRNAPIPKVFVQFS